MGDFFSCWISWGISRGAPVYLYWENDERCGPLGATAVDSPTPTRHDCPPRVRSYELSRGLGMDTATTHQSLAPDILRHRTGNLRSSIEAEVRHTLSGVWAGLSDDQLEQGADQTSSLTWCLSSILNWGTTGGPTIHHVSTPAPREQIADSTHTRIGQPPMQVSGVSRYKTGSQLRQRKQPK